MKPTRIIQTIIVVFVAAAVVIGVYMAGSPGYARKERVDSERSNRLSTLSNNISNYYQVNGVLPKTLQSLEMKDVSRYKDPETGEWFVYEPLSDREFQLCATFATAHEEPYYGPNTRYVPSLNGEYEPTFIEQQSPYSHDVGYQCFSYMMSAKK